MVCSCVRSAAHGESGGSAEEGETEEEGDPHALSNTERKRGGVVLSAFLICTPSMPFRQLLLGVGVVCSTAPLLLLCG